MSTEAMNAAWSALVLDPESKLVLLALADGCSPASVAARCGLDADRAQLVLTELESNDLIAISEGRVWFNRGAHWIDIAGQVRRQRPQ